MSGTFDQSKRQVIPRWLSYHASNALQLLSSESSSRSTLSRTRAGLSAQEKWQNDNNLSHAVDFVGEAIVISDFDNAQALDAAKFILTNVSSEKKHVRALAKHYVDPRDDISEDDQFAVKTDPINSRISSLKSRTATHPIDPISWADLSLLYAIAGSRSKSIRCMSVALGLSKGNRFVLRSAARCFVHFGEPDRALDIIRKSAQCKSDPWIAASEIAIAESAGLKNRCLRPGRQLVANDNLSQFSRSELAATISTLELAHGSSRKAKVFMRKALLEPTENSLAQAEWMAANLSSSPTVELEEYPASYEARAQHYYHLKDYDRTIQAARLWADFQPLSSRPLAQASFIASVVLNDDSRSISLLRDSALVRQFDPILTNNYAFALMRQGRISEASELLRRIDKRSLPLREQLILSATNGLLAFKQGNPEQGRDLYSLSVKGLDGLGEYRGAAIAKCFWAIAEIDSESDFAKATSADAMKRVKKQKMTELDVYTNMLKNANP
ncbi:MAG: hypothetical protein KOO63_05285 [Bacteroidales bacterium]|nr:hypothetical protein [Candidatus Latescibacterota bacterium]